MTVDMSITHEDYDRMWPRWMMCYDFFRGGVHVLSPSWFELESRVVVPSSDGPVRLRWSSQQARSYIHRHPRESDDAYAVRRARAWHLPIFRQVVNTFASAVMRAGASRIGATEPPWDMWLSDVDARGTPMDSFCREALTMALVFGRHHTLIDMPSADGELPTIGAQTRAGIRPYAYQVTPLDLTNWAVDARGRFRWVQIREDAPDDSPWGKRSAPRASQYRVWTDREWYLYRRDQRGEWGEVASGTHPCGRVPLETIYAHRGTHSILGCESPFADICDGDRAVYNYFSMLDELHAKETFSILAWPHREGSMTPDAIIGPGFAVQYDSEAGAPQFIGPDPAIASGLLAMIMDVISLIRAQSESARNTMAREQSLEARSADAIRQESRDRTNIMASLAQSMEVYEAGIYSLMCAWSGQTDAPAALYDRRFDDQTIDEAIGSLERLTKIGVERERIEAIADPIIARMAREYRTGTDDTA